MSTIKVMIQEQIYNLQLDDSDTVEEFLHLLPLEFSMNELNGNEKYVYLNSSLPIHSYHPKTIHKGDVMLYGDNCLVVFYESFPTEYSYTKIGFIENLPDLGNGSISVRFEKKEN